MPNAYRPIIWPILQNPARVIRRELFLNGQTVNERFGDIRNVIFRQETDFRMTFRQNTETFCPEKSSDHSFLVHGAQEQFCEKSSSDASQTLWKAYSQPIRCMSHCSQRTGMIPQLTSPENCAQICLSIPCSDFRLARRILFTVLTISLKAFICLFSNHEIGI